MHAIILCHSVSLNCPHHMRSSFPTQPPTPPPQSDIMGQSKVTHIYPIIRGFEKTQIELQLMLQWGPESERCYRPKRLGFQGPANKRQSSPQRERERGGGGGRSETVASEAFAASVSEGSVCVVSGFMIEGSV